ncbi:SGNH/GDSL hydrolase family protein [Mycoplasma hafezii]|uniref:SGNH/GDSL hydrolase family protein n=1 Tax=Mycoplasma hafezii TaxID=525886 RepID=UPI003CEABFA9
MEKSRNHKEVFIKFIKSLGRKIAIEINKEINHKNFYFSNLINNKPINDFNQITRTVSKDFVQNNQKINYVAIGDSLAAGFDGFLDDDYYGEIIDNHVVGSSYPAYFADILMQTKQLGSFNNYSVNSSSIQEWIDFFKGCPSEFSLVLANSKERNISVNSIKQELKNANLITISIGAMDFFYLFFENLFNNDFSNLIDQLDSPEIIQIFDEYLKNKYFEIMSKLKAQLAELLQIIKTITPTSNINLIAYPIPFLGLKHVIDQYFFKVNELNCDFSILETFIGLLNNNMKEVAIEQQCNWINLYNNDYWDQNIAKFSSTYVDIHPNIKGYKKMALDLYLKLSNPSFDTKTYSQNYHFNYNYWMSDANQFTYQFNKSKLFESAIPKNDEGYLKNTHELEQKIIDKGNYKNFAKRLIKYEGWIKNSSPTIAMNFFKTEFYNKLDPNLLLLNYINKYSSATKLTEEFVLTLVQNKVIHNILDNIQLTCNDIVKTPELSAEIILDRILSEIKNTNNYLKIIELILELELCHYNLDEFIDILGELIDNAVNYLSPKIISALQNTFTKYHQKLNLDLQATIHNLQRFVNQNQARWTSILKTLILNTLKIAIINYQIDSIKNKKIINSFDLTKSMLFFSNIKQEQDYSTLVVTNLIQIMNLLIQDTKTLDIFVSEIAILISSKLKFNPQKIIALLDNLIGILFKDQQKSKIQQLLTEVLSVLIKELQNTNDFKAWFITIKKSLAKNKFIKNQVLKHFMKLKLSNKVTLIQLLLKQKHMKNSSS